MSDAFCNLCEHALRSEFETRSPSSIEFSYAGPDGLRQYASRLVPEITHSGLAEFVLGITQDVTERKWILESLQNADRRKDEFLATLAHELRNPLAPLRSGLQVLGLSQGPAIALETRKMMDRQLSHMVRLIDDLLDASRITNDKLTLRKEHVLLSTITEVAVEASRPLIDASKHRLELALPEEPLWLYADPTRLSQVVRNLLANSAKYTPEGGRIGIAAVR
jgi:signal transduction histidine kinase